MDKVFRTNVEDLPFVTVSDNIQVGELIYGSTDGVGFQPVYDFLVELKGHDHLMLKKMKRTEARFTRKGQPEPFIGGRLN